LSSLITHTPRAIHTMRSLLRSSTSGLRRRSSSKKSKDDEEPTSKKASAAPAPTPKDEEDREEEAAGPERKKTKSVFGRIADAADDLAEGLADAAKGIAHAAADAADVAADSVSDVARGAGSVVSGTVKGLASAASDAAEGVGDAMAKSAKAVRRGIMERAVPVTDEEVVARTPSALWYHPSSGWPEVQTWAKPSSGGRSRVPPLLVPTAKEAPALYQARPAAVGVLRLELLEARGLKIKDKLSRSSDPCVCCVPLHPY
jgi:hypothetical protein